MRHTISIDHLWKTSGQSLTNVQGLRGDRTWYTKERAGVPNLIRVAFGTGKGGSGVRNHIRRVLVHQEVISDTKLSCDDSWHTRRAFCVRIVCGNTFIKRIITSSLMASEHIQASIFIRNRGERFVRYSLISYICRGELVIIWK